MSTDTWFLYVGTVLLLMSTPGPSQLLMLSNSISSGFRKSINTAFGDLSANLLQMIAASIGLVGVIANSRSFFIAVKWAGVAYLLYLGLRLILRRPEALPDGTAPVKSGRTLYLQGFVTSAANPKAVVFFAALFPQFIDPGAPLFMQFAILSATYLIMDATFLCLYGVGAGWIAKRMQPRARLRLNRASGGFLIGAAVLLGLKDPEAQV
ncbi:MAG: LysE family translocator [Pseudomonadota bacterium]